MVTYSTPGGDWSEQQKKKAQSTYGYSAHQEGSSLIKNYNYDVLGQEMLQGGNELAMSNLAKETDTRGKALYAYLLQRQAEAKVGSTVPKSSSAPLLGVENKDTMKALDKATALLTALKSGKSLIG